MKIKISDIRHNLINNVDVMLPDEGETYKERYFEWTESNLTVDFKSNKISGGVLRTWHHTPVFNEVETHIDKEMFYFVSGTAIMLFIDIINGKPDMNSANMVKISPGTQIVIGAGKGHFIAVAYDSEPVHAIVVAPKMESPRINLPQTIIGY